jgi:chromosome segregation ATPase
MGISKSTMANPHHDGDDAQFTATFDDEALKTDMKLLWAERENIDLKLKLHGVESEARRLKAKARELEAAALSARASTVPDGVDFLQKHHELQKALEEKEQDAHYARTRMQALEADNETLTNELDVMKLRLDESEARCNDGPDNQALVEDNNALRSRVEMLAMKYDETTAQHYASMDTIQNMTDATRFLRTKNDNNESEIQVPRANIAAAESDRDWYVIRDPRALRWIFWRPKKSPTLREDIQAPPRLSMLTFAQAPIRAYEDARDQEQPERCHQPRAPDRQAES